jgi:chaperonin GroES
MSTLIDAATFIPIGNRVLIEAQEEDEVTAGGVIIPDAARERPQRGKVLAVGPGDRDQNGAVWPVAVTVGDTVVFSKYGGTEIRLGTTDYLILREPDILGVLRD